MSNSFAAACKEAAVKAGDFLEELIKIADKYKLNRTEFIKKNAMTFFNTVRLGRFDDFELTEREETENE